MTALVQLITTFPEREQAVAVAREVVGAGLAACVQVIDPVTSVYRWEGSLQEERESLCLMKVPADGLARLADRVRELHPYDTPELTALESSFVDERYLAWAVDATT